MYEVSIVFGTEDGDGIDSVLVDIEERGFDTALHERVIHLAIADFEKRERFAVIESMQIREVPNRVIRP